MTRNFRDEWEAANAARSNDEGADDVAPDDIQDRVSAKLRAAATDEARDTVMPSDVEARMRAAFKSEFGGMASGFTDEAVSSSQTPSSASGSGTVVPLPGRRRPVSEDSEVTRPAGTWADSSPSTTSPAAASNRPAGASTAPSGVRSLDEHRATRRGGLGKGALALGAAAAVAIGAVAVSKSLGSNDSQVADSPSISQSSGAAQQNYASRVRVTQTETKYSAGTLATQAASLPTSKSTPIEPKQADAQSLGPLATGTGVQSCLQAVDASLSQTPDKVYADFGTYEGQPAVIVVTVKDGKKTAWVVSRTCSKASDLKAGPTSITT